mmetsp:Transcript_22534/g.49414  ORF Transcript_22534/g.49414 Transcript_22534/m.49414 type:complete len:312 (-) Transcript_22534:493-1428(-)
MTVTRSLSATSQTLARHLPRGGRSRRLLLLLLLLLLRARGGPLRAACPELLPGHGATPGLVGQGDDAEEAIPEKHAEHDSEEECEAHKADNDKGGTERRISADRCRVWTLTFEHIVHPGEGETPLPKGGHHVFHDFQSAKGPFVVHDVQNRNAAIDSTILDDPRMEIAVGVRPIIAVKIAEDDRIASLQQDFVHVAAHQSLWGTEPPSFVRVRPGAVQCVTNDGLPLIDRSGEFLKAELGHGRVLDPMVAQLMALCHSPFERGLTLVCSNVFVGDDKKGGLDVFRGEVVQDEIESCGVGADSVIEGKGHSF